LNDIGYAFYIMNLLVAVDLIFELRVRY